MKIEASIRAITREERQAKRDWGTGACEARGCSARASFLTMEILSGESGSEEWWQYCCLKHAKQFAEERGLKMPAVTPHNRPGRDPVSCVSGPLT